MSLDRAGYIGLRPDLTIKADSGQPAVWRGERELASLKGGEPAISLLARLLPRVSAHPSSVDELLKDLAEEGISEEESLALLEDLHAAGLLYRFFEPNDAAAAARYSPLHSNPQPLLDRVRRSRISVLGDSTLCRAVVRALEGCGFENLERCQPSGPALSFLTGELDLVIAFDLSPDTAFSVNSWCLANGTPFLPGWGSGFEVHFGPVVVRGDAPCLACMVGPGGRFHGWTNFDPGPVAANPGMLAAAGNLAAGLAFDFLAEGGEPDGFRRHRRVHLRDGSVEDVPVLRNPRCRECGRLREWSEGGVGLGT